MGTMVLPYLTIYLSDELGLGALAGLIIGLYGVGGILGSFLGGWATDRFGPRPVMTASLVLSAGVFLVLKDARSAQACGAGLLVLAIVVEGIRPAASVAMASACPGALRTRGFALQRLAINAGMALGALAGGYLAEWDYNALFLVDAATCLASAAFLVWAVPSLGVVAPSATQEGAQTDSTPRIEGNLSPWRDAQFLLVMGLMGVSSFLFFNLFTVLPLYLHDVYDLSESRIGLVFACNTAIILLFEMVLTHRTSAHSPLRVIGVGVLFLGVGVAFLPWGHGLGFALFCVALYTIGEMLMAPAGTAYTAQRAAPKSIGKYMGMMSMVFSLGHVIGPAGSLFIYHNLGRDIVWHASGALGLVLCAGYFLVAARSLRHR